MGKTKSKVKKKQRRMKEKELRNQTKIEALSQQNKKRKFLL